MELTKQHCVPCEGGTQPLLKREAHAYHSEIPEWTLHQKSIEREFRFKNFKESMEFVNKVADIAEGTSNLSFVLFTVTTPMALKDAPATKLAGAEKHINALWLPYAQPGLCGHLTIRCTILIIINLNEYGSDEPLFNHRSRDEKSAQKSFGDAG